MKKLVLILLSLLFTLTCFAEGHMLFKGIEINGTLSQFKNSLTKQGFTVAESEENALAFKGTFAGYDNCAILVSATPVEKMVYTVVVVLPEQDSWYSLKSRFNEFKESLTKKYGKPYQDIHYFSDPYYEGDGYEMQAINYHKCSYAAMYQTPLGEIGVMIYEAGRRTASVVLIYKDKINDALNEKAAHDSRSNDL